MQRIEKGGPGYGIGAVFEAAAVVGVRLFDADHVTLTSPIGANATMLSVLPKVVRVSKVEAKDDF